MKSWWVVGWMLVGTRAEVVMDGICLSVVVTEDLVEVVAGQ